MNIYKKDDVKFPMIEFVSRAISKDPIRPHICLMNITDSYFECTDGARIHRCTLPLAIPAGLYKVIKTAKEIILVRSQNVVFPDTDSIIQKNGDTLALTLEKDGLYGAICKIILATKNHFNIEYLEQALKYERQVLECNVYSNGDCTPLRLTSSFFDITILCLRR